MFRPHQIEDSASYFSLLSETVSALPWDAIDGFATVLERGYETNRTTFLFGNGGSASLASHFACDLSKGTSVHSDSRKRFRAIALTDNIPTITALANDLGYEDIFAEQLKNLIQPRDIAFAISCSGNSPNVLKALEVARAAGAITLGLGGFKGGQMKSLCDSCVIVPSENMQVIEDLHLSVAHCLFTLVRNHIVERSYRSAVATSAS